MEQMVKDAIKADFTKYVKPWAFTDEVAKQLDYLYSRWLDEREYEDWKDYEDAMKKLIPDTCTFVRSTRRPIGFVVRPKDSLWLFHVYGKIKGNYFTLKVKVEKA